MDDDHKKTPPLIEGQVVKRVEPNLPDMERAIPTPLPPRQMNFLARLRESSETKLLRAKEEKADAMKGYLEALDGALQAKTNLNVTREIADNIDSLREEARTQVRTNLTTRKSELEDAVHELEMKRLRNQAEREALEDQIARAKEPPKRKPQKERRSFAEDAEDMLRYGAMGSNRADAEKAIAQFIEEKGGEEYLSAEDHERITGLRLHATRLDQSKG